jgi:hypothetical protein
VDFEITSARDTDVLLLSFTGRSTRENAKAMTQRYFDIVKESGQRKVLADICRLEGRLSATDTYFLVRDLPARPLPGIIRTAILETPQRHEYAEFLEATAENAGINFKCFFDRQEALSWLRGKS